MDEAAPSEFWTCNLKAPETADFTQVVGPAFKMEAENQELDFFHQFFPVSLVEELVLQTNKYAAKCIQNKRDKMWVDTTFDEMMAYLGMHVLFSVIGLPTYSLAWKTTWPFEIPAVPQIMTRTRFERLSKYFRVNDTSLNPPRGQPGHDKLCHIRPVLTIVNNACLNNYRPHKEQSVREGMIALNDQVSSKQSVPPVPQISASHMRNSAQHMRNSASACGIFAESMRNSAMLCGTPQRFHNMRNLFHIPHRNIFCIHMENLRKIQT